MTFLTPLPAIIAACIALPILLLYYFLKLRRRAVRVSSTLLWERATKDLQVNTPFRWLRISFLLLVQLLILAALLLALARPALHDPLGATRRVVFLIDRSASMDALDAFDNTAASDSLAATRVTRLAQAKIEAQRILDKLSGTGWLSRIFGSSQPPTSVCVIDFAAAPRVRLPFSTDPAAIREAIDSITQSDQPATLAAALQLVAGLTTSTDESQATEPTTLFIFSDGSFKDPPADLVTPNALLRYIQIGPTPTVPSATESPPVPSTFDSILPTENLGITAISARRDTESPSTVRVFVRVQSNSPRTIRGSARLRINGRDADSRSFTVGPIPNAAPLPTATSPASSDSLAPASFEAPVIFEIDSPEGGTLVVSLPAIDLLTSDNAAAVVLAPARTPRILVVAPDAAPDELLMLALDGLAPAALSTIPPAYYEQFASGARVIDPTGNEFTSRLSDWDLVVFDRYRPERLPPSPSISIGAGLPVPGLSVRPSLDSESDTARFSTWRRTHPIMRSVTLDTILIAPPMRMTLPDSPSINSIPLAWGDATGTGTISGPLIALLEPIGPAETRDQPGSTPGAPGTPIAPTLAGAKRLVLAFELAQSNWGIEFSFPVFIVNAVEHLALVQSGIASRSYRTDEPISVAIPQNTLPSAVTQAFITGPLATTAIVRRGHTPAPSSTPPDASPPAEIIVGTLERAGIYRVRAAGTDLTGSSGSLAVNLADPWESRAAVATRLALPASSSTRDLADTIESRREIWHWLVAAALLLLCLEWSFFARGMRA